MWKLSGDAPSKTHPKNAGYIDVLSKGLIEYMAQKAALKGGFFFRHISAQFQLSI